LLETAGLVPANVGIRAELFNALRWTLIMEIDSNTDHPAGFDGTSITTRRSFIVAASLGAVSLYGLWAGLGVAPLRFWKTGGTAAAGSGTEGGGHDEHGGGAGGDATAFRQAVDKFVAEHLQPDGSVFVEPTSMPAGSPSAAHDMTNMPGMNMANSTASGTPDADEILDGTHGTESHDTMAMPADVYLLAQQWSFEPSWLRLKVGVSYRLKLMAVDAAHGASLQLGPGSEIIRLPKGIQVERAITFTRPGTYLIYCTVYCGEGHQFMSGKLEIV
jgi:cytochrome c oxidase subunit 2